MIAVAASEDAGAINVFNVRMFIDAETTWRLYLRAIPELRSHCTMK
jgi:hypothetical protein